MLRAAFAFIAVIAAAALLINVIRLIALIVLIGCVTMIVVIVISWALAAYHYRKTGRREQAIALAQALSAVPARDTLASSGEPAAGFAEIALLGRVLSQTEELIARQFADAVADGQDQAAINDLISKVLRGPGT